MARPKKLHIELELSFEGVDKWINAKSKEMLETYPKLSLPGRKELIRMALFQLWTAKQLEEWCKKGNVTDTEIVTVVFGLYRKLADGYRQTLTGAGIIKASKYEARGDNAKVDKIPKPSEMRKRMGLDKDDE